MVSSTRAELLRLLKWPVTWVVVGVWSVMNLFFAYVLTYLTYRSAVSDGNPFVARALLADMSLASLHSTLEVVTNVLPGTAAGSLAGALGASGPGAGSPNGTPGVLTTLGGGSAAALLLVYAVLFVVLMAVVVRRRDA